MVEQSATLPSSSPLAGPRSADFQPTLDWLDRFYLWLNRFFPRPPHPFDQGKGKLNYSQFEYETAPQVFALYHDLLPPQSLVGKEVLDIACGGGGKTVYLLEQGTAKVVGIDKMALFIEQAQAFANVKNLTTRSHFLVADSSALPFPANSFDLAILNDAMEHVADPYTTLKEAARVLRLGGRVLINFEPYYHPRGGHVSDVVGLPWEHVFFSERRRIKLYKYLVRNLPDGAERVAFRVGQRNGQEAFTYLNHLTIRRFWHYLDCLRPGLVVEKYRLLSFAKPVLPYFARLPWFREFFTKNVICVLRRV